MDPYQAQTQKTNDQPQTPMDLKISKFISWFAYAWTMFGVIMLLLRTFLLATSANMTTGFSSFVYRVSSDYLHPFRGIFPPAELSDTGYLDISAIFAAITYLFIGWGFKELIDYVQAKIDRNHQAQEQYLMRQAVRNGTVSSTNSAETLEV